MTYTLVTQTRKPSITGRGRKKYTESVLERIIANGKGKKCLGCGVLLGSVIRKCPICHHKCK